MGVLSEGGKARDGKARRGGAAGDAAVLCLRGLHGLRRGIQRGFHFGVGLIIRRKRDHKGRHAVHAPGGIHPGGLDLQREGNQLLEARGVAEEAVSHDHIGQRVFVISAVIGLSVLGKREGVKHGLRAERRSVSGGQLCRVIAHRNQRDHVLCRVAGRGRGVQRLDRVVLHSLHLRVGELVQRVRHRGVGHHICGDPGFVAVGSGAVLGIGRGDAVQQRSLGDGRIVAAGGAAAVKGDGKEHLAVAPGFVIGRLHLDAVGLSVVVGVNGNRGRGGACLGICILSCEPGGSVRRVVIGKDVLCKLQINARRPFGNGNGVKRHRVGGDHFAAGIVIFIGRVAVFRLFDPGQLRLSRERGEERRILEGDGEQRQAVHAVIIRRLDHDEIHDAVFIRVNRYICSICACHECFALIPPVEPGHSVGGVIVGQNILGEFEVDARRALRDRDRVNKHRIAGHRIIGRRRVAVGRIAVFRHADAFHLGRSDESGKGRGGGKGDGKADVAAAGHLDLDAVGLAVVVPVNVHSDLGGADSIVEFAGDVSGTVSRVVIGQNVFGKLQVNALRSVRHCENIKQHRIGEDRLPCHRVIGIGRIAARLLGNHRQRGRSDRGGKGQAFLPQRHDVIKGIVIIVHDPVGIAAGEIIVLIIFVELDVVLHILIDKCVTVVERSPVLSGHARVAGFPCADKRQIVGHDVFKLRKYDLLRAGRHLAGKQVNRLAHIVLADLDAVFGRELQLVVRQRRDRQEAHDQHKNQQQAQNLLFHRNTSQTKK